MRACAALVLLLLGASGARAAFEDLGVGARAPGMADAFTAVADDVYTLHYNPAGLGLIERPQLGTAYSVLYPGLTDGSQLGNSFIGYAQPLKEGKAGALGAAWTSFSLNNSLYRDDKLGLSYGRPVLESPERGSVYGGMSLDYLRSSFGSTPEATNGVPTNGVAGSGLADPVLNGKRAKGAFDADLGVLHRFAQRYSWGLSLAHVLQPNVAFSGADSDKLPLEARLGAAYRSPISNISVQVMSQRAPGAGQDNVFSVGVERWFAKLLVGDFGLRGGMALGSRDYKQASAGVSFRTRRLEVDYALGLPLGGIQVPVGAHRIALTFRFGPATEEEESVEAVLEAMKQLRAGQLVVPRATTAALPRADKAVLEEYLALARSLTSKARYAEAMEKLGDALTVAPADKELVARFGRLSFVGRQIKRLPDFRSDPAQAALHLGLLSYVAGDETQAIADVAQALQLKPEWRELDVFLSELEAATGLKRPAGIGHPDRDVMLRLTRANAAIEDGEFGQAVDLALSVVRVEPRNAMAWMDLGTAYFGLKDYGSSLRAWEKAYSYENTPAVRTAIRRYIKGIHRLQRKTEERPAPEPKGKPLPQRVVSPLEEQRLLDKSVDAYTRGDFAEARRLLETILESDPDNAEAQKALRRIKEEQP